MPNYLDNIDIIDGNGTTTNVLLQDRGTLALANQIASNLASEITNRENADTAINTTIGNLNNLNTVDKTSVINAINENVANIGELEDTISNYLIPDDFSGTDGEKLQSAFDALETSGGTIILDRVYTLDRNILIKRKTNNPNHKEITVIGLGKEGGLDFAEYSIKGYDTNYRTYGGLRFINVKMTGTETAFITDNLIRINLSNCDIWFFKYVFYGTDTNSCQSIFVSDCSIQYIKNCVHYSYRQAWDVHYNCNRIELCDKVFYIREAKILTITNNLIEGKGVFDTLQGFKVIEIVNSYYGLTISGNYFEDNETSIYMADCSNGIYNHAVIEGNSFWEHLEGVKCIVLPTSVSNAQILLSHNTFSLASNSYGIAISETGHVLNGVQINACNGTNYDIYDPANQLHDIATYANSDTVTATATYTPNTLTGLSLRRYGKICTLNGIITLGQSMASGDEILKLDDLHDAPDKVTAFPIHIMGASGTISGAIRGNVGTNGSVYVQSSLSNGDSILIDATWVCK